MKQSLNLLDRVLGKEAEKGFSCPAIKKLHLKSMICQLFWLLKGNGNVKHGQDNEARIWNEQTNGKRGRINQIGKIVEVIRNSPNSHRNVSV